MKITTTTLLATIIIIFATVDLHGIKVSNLAVAVTINEAKLATHQYYIAPLYPLLFFLCHLTLPLEE